MNIQADLYIMHIYVYIYKHICEGTNIGVYIHGYNSVYLYKFMHTESLQFMHTCIGIFTCTCMHMCEHVGICVCVYVHFNLYCA